MHCNKKNKTMEKQQKAGEAKQREYLLHVFATSAIRGFKKNVSERYKTRFFMHNNCNET